jgi:Bacteriophage related domain of unknown function
MADDAVYDAIRAYLEMPATVAGLADPITSVVPPFRFENEAFDKPDPPAAWIAMALTGVLYGQKTIQVNGRWDEAGHLWLSVFAPVGTGSSRPRQLAKMLADIFRDQTLLGGNLEFLDVFIGEGSPAPEEGNYYQLPVVIEWRHLNA